MRMNRSKIGGIPSKQRDKNMTKRQRKAARQETMVVAMSIVGMMAVVVVGFLISYGHYNAVNGF